MRSRTDLIEYLCAQQHAAYEEAALLEGLPPHGPWVGIPDSERSAARVCMRSVLEELEDLGLLVSARVPA